MADEIQALISLSISKSGTTASGSTSLSQTLSGSNYQGFIQDVTATAASAKQSVQIDSNIATGGWIMVKNTVTDTSLTTQYLAVALASTAGQLLANLYPTEAIVVKNCAGLYIASVGATNAAAVVVTEP